MTIRVRRCTFCFAHAETFQAGTPTLTPALTQTRTSAQTQVYVRARSHACKLPPTLTLTSVCAGGRPSHPSTLKNAHAHTCAINAPQTHHSGTSLLFLCMPSNPNHIYSFPPPISEPDRFKLRGFHENLDHHLI